MNILINIILGIFSLLTFPISISLFIVVLMMQIFNIPLEGKPVKIKRSDLVWFVFWINAIFDYCMRSNDEQGSI